MGFFFHDKADTYDIFKKFITRAENEFELKVKKVRSDNGSEFRNTRVEEGCDEKEIKHEFSTKYTPEQNDLVERTNRTLLIWQDQCSPSIMFRIIFGPKQLTQLVMPQIGYIVIDFITRPHMSCLLEESQISHILECLVASVIFSRRELGYQSSKVNVMGVFFLGIHHVARLIGSTTKLMALLKKPMMWSLMKQMGLIMNKKILMM